MSLNSRYVVKGNVLVMPSKLSETVGLRVYAKLHRPYAMFFRNPSFAGLWSENLRAGEIEFIFGVRKEQVNYVGGVKVIQLVRKQVSGGLSGSSGDITFSDGQELHRRNLYIRQHREANCQYQLASNSLTKSFVEYDDDLNRPIWDVDVFTHGSLNSDFALLQDDSDPPNLIGTNGEKPLRYIFTKWYEQRKFAYYDGYNINRMYSEMSYDPYTWRIYIDEESNICFNEIKLELAKEYWWVMRLGFVKSGFKFDKTKGERTYDKTTGIWPTVLDFSNEDGATKTVTFGGDFDFINQIKTTNDGDSPIMYSWADKVVIMGDMGNNINYSDNFSKIVSQIIVKDDAGNCRCRVKYGDTIIGGPPGSATVIENVVMVDPAETPGIPGNLLWMNPEVCVIAQTELEFWRKCQQTIELWNKEREKQPENRMSFIGPKNESTVTTTTTWRGFWWWSGYRWYLKWAFNATHWYIWHYYRWSRWIRDWRYIGPIYVYPFWLRWNGYWGPYTKLEIEPQFHEIYLWSEALSEYQDYYFMSENDDDNNEAVLAYTKYVLGEDGGDEYKGGIVNVSEESGSLQLSYLDNMNFHRPFDKDLDGRPFEQVVDRNNYVFYKARITMPTPGELYYIGVVLLHKQYMLYPEDKSLNSDIVVIPMVSRPDTPDWCDSKGAEGNDTIKDMLPFQSWDDYDSVYMPFTVNRLSDRLTSSSGNENTTGLIYYNYPAGHPSGMSGSTQIRAIRQICGPRSTEWLAEDSHRAGEYTDLNVPYGALWKIPFKEGTRYGLQTEGITILSGANTSVTSLGLVWSIKSTTLPMEYIANDIIQEGDALNISDWNDYTVYIQAPYPDNASPTKIRYIKLFRDEDYGQLENVNDPAANDVIIDPDMSALVGGFTQGFRTPGSAGNPGRIIKDSVRAAIEMRTDTTKMTSITTPNVLGVAIDPINIFAGDRGFGLGKGLIEMYSKQGLYPAIVTDETTAAFIPMYESNTNYFEEPLMILGNLQDMNSGIGCIRWEQRNRMVRKFFLFFAEVKEDGYLSRDYPLSITNRDWTEGNAAMTESLNKFHQSRKFVIKRFNNDGQYLPHELRYIRWGPTDSAFDNIYTFASLYDTTNPYSSILGEPYGHSFEIYRTIDIINYDPNNPPFPIARLGAAGSSLDPNDDGFGNWTGDYTFTFQELNQSGTPTGAVINIIILCITSNHGRFNNNTPEDNGFAYGWRVEDYTLNGIPCDVHTRCGGNDLLQRVNGIVMAFPVQSHTVPNNSLYIINDLTEYMNTGFDDNQDDPSDGKMFEQLLLTTIYQGTRHYRCSQADHYEAFSNSVRNNSLDCYLVRDSIRIFAPGFTTSIQRAYCLASIIETHDPNMNYWTYANRGEWGSGQFHF